MRQVSKAIQYIINELGVSAFELKNIIKSVRENNSNSYEAYLARELVTMAEEKWDIPYTQLLVKWGEYIIEIEEATSTQSLDSMSPLMQDYVANLSEEEFIFGFDPFAGLVEGFTPYGDSTKWATEVDLDEVNTYFLDGATSHFREAFLDSANLTLVADFTSHHTTPALGTADLKVSAKSDYGVTIRDYADIILMRALNLYQAHDKDLSLVLLTSADFWATRSEVAEVFLNNFKLARGQSFYIDAREVQPANLRDGNFLVCRFEANPEGTKGIQLSDTEGRNPKVFYAKGIAEVAVLSTWGNPDSDSYTITADGEVSSSKTLSGYSTALAYYTVNGVDSFESLPRQGAKNMPVTAENFTRLATLATLGTAFSNDIRYSAGIPAVLDGLPNLVNLMADSLPFMFYGSKSNLKFWGVKRTANGIEEIGTKFSPNSREIKSQLEELLPFMSLKAKTLWEFAEDIAEDEGMSFIEYRNKVVGGEVRDDDFLDDYNRYESELLTYIVDNYSSLISKV